MSRIPSDTALERSLLEKLTHRKQKSTFRQLTAIPPDSVDFSSNDFLSLAKSDEFRSAYLNEVTNASSEHFQIGSGGARLLDGNSPYAEELEQTIAAFHRAPTGLLWNSGFDANSGFFACVPQPGDFILHDELIHASVHEGMKLTRAAQCLSFQHNCVSDLRGKLETLIQEKPGVREGRHSVIVAVESVYSMDGDLAPLAEIVKILDELLPSGNGHIVVDEAHATGVIGPQGRGLVCELGLERRVFARLHTFGKALACSGAIILCSPVVKSYLINYARPFIYTTAMTFPSLATIRVAYSLLQSNRAQQRASRLQHLIGVLFDTLCEMEGDNSDHTTSKRRITLPATCPRSPIFSLLTDSPRSLAKFCQEAGMVVRAIVPPTVPTRRVRVCLHAMNTEEEIRRLVVHIQEWMRHGKDDVLADTVATASVARARL